MANRHALLIGVPHYDDDDFNEPRLADAVRSDVAAMRAALKQSHYLIEECPTPGAEGGCEGEPKAKINFPDIPNGPWPPPISKLILQSGLTQPVPTG